MYNNPRKPTCIHWPYQMCTLLCPLLATENTLHPSFWRFNHLHILRLTSMLFFFLIAKYYYQDKKTHLERNQNHYAYTSLIHSCVSLQKFQEDQLPSRLGTDDIVALDCAPSWCWDSQCTLHRDSLRLLVTTDILLHKRPIPPVGITARVCSFCFYSLTLHSMRHLSAAWLTT